MLPHPVMVPSPTRWTPRTGFVATGLTPSMEMLYGQIRRLSGMSYPRAR
jgi:hypothetical protein